MIAILLFLAISAIIFYFFNFHIFNDQFSDKLKISISALACSFGLGLIMTFFIACIYGLSSDDEVRAYRHVREIDDTSINLTEKGVTLIYRNEDGFNIKEIPISEITFSYDNSEFEFGEKIIHHKFIHNKGLYQLGINFLSKMFYTADYETNEGYIYYLNESNKMNFYKIVLKGKL